MVYLYDDGGWKFPHVTDVHNVAVVGRPSHKGTRCGRVSSPAWSLGGEGPLERESTTLFYQPVIWCVGVLGSFGCVFFFKFILWNCEVDSEQYMYMTYSICESTSLLSGEILCLQKGQLLRNEGKTGRFSD